MNPQDHEIKDEELLQFLWEDGLEPFRREQIALALSQQPGLSARLLSLQSTVQLAVAEPLPEPPPGFEKRLMQRLSERTLAEACAYPFRPGAAPELRASHSRRSHRNRRLLRRLGAGLAAALLLSVGFLAGRQSGPEQAHLAADRIYAAMLVQHLGASQRGLMSVVNAGPALAEGNAELARALLDNNRLYRAAAERHGDHRSLDLLQRLEPVLIELANPAGADSIEVRTGLGEYVQRSDLIFELRAAQAGFAARGSTTSI